MTSYCCQQYAEFLITTLFQQDSAPVHCTAHVQQLNCCVKKCQSFLRPTCGLQTAQISVLWITRSGLLCSIVSTTDKSIFEMAAHRRLVRCWTVNFWRGYWPVARRHRACVHAKERHFEYSLWTEDAHFVHICYIQCDLFDCYIFN